MMACEKSLIGNVQVRVDGEILYAESGATIDTGGAEKEAKMGGDGSYHGIFVKQNKPAEIECTLNIPRSFDLQKLRDTCCATITYETDNGLMFVVRNACLANTVKITGNDGGKVQVKFIGAPAEQA